MPKKALLLMNMGGATTRNELRMFLMNMFRDPNILTIPSDIIRGLIAWLIVVRRLDTSWANYEGIGGSPLPRITGGLVAKLEEKIGDTYRIIPVMCYTKPGNEEAIEILLKEGITEVILFPLYPHYSTTTVKSSVESFLEMADDRFQITVIEPFYTDISYNQVIVEKIQQALGGICHADEGSICSDSSQSRFFASSEGQKQNPSFENDKKPRTKNQEPSDTILLFSAHGLPEKIIKRGDPYQRQIEDHVRILSELLVKGGIYFKQVKLAYQSRVGPMKWIGPSLEESLTELKGENVLVYPISFTIDNSETIYELHQEYQEIAKEIGVKSYAVCDCPNTDDEFVESIISLSSRLISNGNTR